MMGNFNVKRREVWNVVMMADQSRLPAMNRCEEENRSVIAAFNCGSHKTKKETFLSGFS